MTGREETASSSVACSEDGAAEKHRGKKKTNKITRRNPESHVSPGVRRPKSARDANAKGMASKLTWTLVALRAATEPTKEEAMQDIVEVFVFW